MVLIGLESTVVGKVWLTYKHHCVSIQTLVPLKVFLLFFVIWTP